MELVDELGPALPTELQVEVTGACNLQCRMCLVRYRPRLGRVSGSLPLEQFTALLDAIPSLRRVTLQGLGEPLLAPHLRSMITDATARGLEVGFNTNGMLLDEEWSRWLVDHDVAWLHVSIDGATDEVHEHIRDGSNRRRIIENLKTLARVRAERRRSVPRIQMNSVAMRQNLHELPQLVAEAASWGVDRAWIQNLSHDFSDTDPASTYVEIRRFTEQQALWPDPTADVELIFDQARRTAERAGLDLRLPGVGVEPAAATGDQAADDDNAPIADDGAAPEVPAGAGCDWPWRSLYVNHDGRVQPCCMVMGSDRAVLGDLREESLAEIWNGDRYRKFRAQLMSDDPPSVCRGCAYYRSTF